MFRLVFAGELITGFAHDAVERSLAKLLKQDEQTIRQRLFNGEPVTVKKVETQAEALKWRKAFANAGAVLVVLSLGDTPPANPAVTETSDKPEALGSAGERTDERDKEQGADSRDPQATSYEEPTLESEAERSPGVRMRNKVYVLLGAAALVFIAVVVLVLWSTKGLWQGVELKQGQRDLGRALLLDDSYALARMDLQRIRELEKLADAEGSWFRSSEPDSLLGSLSAAGINLSEDFDALWLGAYAKADKADALILAQGRYDQAQITHWVNERYSDVETTPEGLRFRSMNENTCELDAPKVLVFRDDLLLMGALERVEQVLPRLTASGAEVPRLAHWYELSEGQLASAAIFLPEHVGRSVPGLGGMMLSGIAKSATPAQGVYLGAEPTLWPAGVEFSVLLESADDEWLSTAKQTMDERLATMREEAALNFPETLPLYDRLSLTRLDNGLQGSIRFDSDIRAEISQWMMAAVGGVFSSGSGNEPMEEKLDDNPPVFENQTTAAPQQFASVGAPQNADTSAPFSTGPFALSIESLAVNEAGQLDIELEAFAYNLPNQPSRGAAALLFIDDVEDARGQSLLARVECGTDKNSEQAEFDRVSSQGEFVEGEWVSYQRVAAEKTITLAKGASFDDVANIIGHIVYHRVTQVGRQTVKQPLAGKTLQAGEMTVRFLGNNAQAINYRTDKDSNKLLHVAALNAEGKPLQDAGASWGGNFWGGGTNALVNYYGDVAAAEVITAVKSEEHRYDFRLADISIQPKDVHVFERNLPPWPQSWQSLLNAQAPQVTYSWREPSQELSAGPARIGVHELDIRKTFGFDLTAELYVPFELAAIMPLAPVNLRVQQLQFASGKVQDVTLQGYSGFTTAGGYWFNGNFELDEERPWLKTDLRLSDRELKAEGVSDVLAELELNLPLSVTRESMVFNLGAEWRNEHFAIQVKKLTKDSLYLSYEGDISTLVGVRAYNGDAFASEPAVLEQVFSDRHIKLPLSALPDRLELTLASKLETARYPVRLAVPQDS